MEGYYKKLCQAFIQLINNVRKQGMTCVLVFSFKVSPFGCICVFFCSLSTHPSSNQSYIPSYVCFLFLQKASNCTDDQKHLSVDGANGIGALKVHEMESHLKKELLISLFNDGSKGKLNHQCGADFVKVQQKPPTGATVLSRCFILQRGSRYDVLFLWFISYEIIDAMFDHKMETVYQLIFGLCHFS